MGERASGRNSKKTKTVLRKTKEKTKRGEKRSEKQEGFGDQACFNDSVIA